jgi:hypothetical protein
MCNPDNMRMMCEIEDRILKALCEETENGLGCVDAEELGEAVDMVKDIAKAKYYASVVEAMNAEKYGAMPERWSEGRHENRHGPEWNDGSMERLGAYDHYRKARDEFKGSGSHDHRRKMEECADSYLHEMEEAVRDIWKDADQMRRERMKAAIMSMVNSLM